jgi:hypothetical protein
VLTKYLFDSRDPKFTCRTTWTTLADSSLSAAWISKFLLHLLPFEKGSELGLMKESLRPIWLDLVAAEYGIHGERGS